MIQRFDYVFSNWIFLWYVAYMLNLVPFNPMSFLIVAGLVNITELLIGMVPNIPMFLIVNFFIKILPIYTLLYVPIKSKDITAGFVYLLIYLLWMFINKEDVMKLRTPFTEFVD